MKEKRNRDRVTAEITPFHLMQMAAERGWKVSREQAMAFLNQERAHEMWQHMMQAGLDFSASTLFADMPGAKELQGIR